MVKSLEFFSKLQHVLYNNLNFFRFRQILFSFARTFAVHREKSFVPAFFEVCIDEIFDNLEFGKEIIVLEKSLEKVLNFGSKYLYEACLILNVAYRNIFQHL